MTSSVNSSRVASWNDTIEFAMLSRYNYRSINWYSFDASENDGNASVSQNFSHHHSEKKISLFRSLSVRNY